jgi:tRNA1Val (adenine37-N6)-methyltransferase
MSSSGDTSLDSIRRGELMLEQPRSGYRFTIDPVLLADFAGRFLPAAPSRLVDLGAGVGVVGLLLARRWPATSVLLVELQPELAELAEANVRRNQLDDRVEVRCLDLRESWRWQDFGASVAVSNPPFYKVGSGRSSPSLQVSLARHEHACSAGELVAAAASGLGPGGQLALVHAAEREAELLQELGRQGLAPKALRRVRPLPDRDPNRLLVLAASPAGSSPILGELPPLLLEERPGVLSAEARQILGEDR